ncbi:segregation/condensation protein A [Candidatus Micrarchaeota archaeon]|nr:segregation/condensation protein A [Candidatus Micrarchaeota archaeon]
MVEKPTWKQMLLELIEQNRIDPWDVDIGLIADGFMKRVRELKTLNLAVEANVILAAAILLKYKSEYLKYLTMEEQTLITDYPADVPEMDGGEEMPQLMFVSRIPPKRQITLDELMGEMEKVMKYENSDMGRAPRGAVGETIDFVISEEDIEKRMDDVLERIRCNTDDTGWSLFSSILKERSSIEIIHTLVSVLHLTQNRTVDVRQDKVFGEIFIHLIEEKKKEKEEMLVRA